MGEHIGSVTRLLAAWSDGDAKALDKLMPLVYDELHRIAEYHWSRQPAGYTLQPSDLIHEAFLKLAGAEPRHFENRTRFFALASIAMRQVLVNHAEARLAKKRGGGAQQVPIDEAEVAIDRAAEQVLALNEALKNLHASDPRKSRVVELRYFGGLSVEETAETVGVSPFTVKRDWLMARAWLARELGAVPKLNV